MPVPHHSVFTGQMPSCYPTNSVKALKAMKNMQKSMKQLLLNFKLECGPMLNVIVALSNIGGTLCSMLQSLARTHCSSAMQ